MAKRGLQFIPIMPKRRVGPNVKRGKVLGVLNHWATNVLSRQSLYPPKPAHVKRRRTGEYGRRWTRRVSGGLGQFFGVQVGTNLEYAPFVGGFKTRKPRQAKATARIGWTSIEEVGNAEWKKTKPKLQRALTGR